MIKIGNKVAFGFNAVQSGMKSSSVNNTPQLIANSTKGKFSITAPVSKAMGIAVGENVMFINNIAMIEQAIVAGNADLVAWAEENGIDINTREGQDAVLKEWTVWAIAKGIPQYHANGNPVENTERMTEDEKKAYIAEHATEILEANREALVERNGGEADDDTLISLIKTDDIEFPKYHVHSGSRTATTSSFTGVGCQLNFTDTSIWTTLKSDLGDDITKKNRVFDVLLDEAFTTTLSNGKENVDVIAYPISYVEDADIMVREKKD